MKSLTPDLQTLTRYLNAPSLELLRKPVEAGRMEDVVRCVANLFQKGKVGEISFNHSHVLFKNGRGYTYEVQYLRGWRTLKRRFTVYRLGGVHSKSECYQVTDPKGKYLVVKIPPQPITDIGEYLKAVTHERRLAEKLFELGIKVVVPCVGSVMRHVHKLEVTEGLSSRELENAYLEVLQTSGNQYVEHFRIDGRFVFFMEFLDEPFLGKVVREFYNKDMLGHLKKDKFERDLLFLKNHDRIGFMGAYKHVGDMKSLYEIFSGLQETFEDFCSKVDSLLKEYAIALGRWKKKDWFIANNLGKQIDEAPFLAHWDLANDDKEVLARKLSILLNEPGEHSELFKKYLEILDQEAHWAAFRYGVRKMQMIGNKLMKLLVMLGKMGLVLRDLKVDNLFVADDENMELGVIDLETGGYVGSGKIDGIIPAGMPSNMTLSNLLFVGQLRRIYGVKKVSTILQMQDWYATISMMFETNIGAVLFDEARSYILKIHREIDDRLTMKYHDFVRNNPRVRVTKIMMENFFSLTDEEIKGHTWQFWDLAKQNLQRRCLEQKSKLMEIEYDLPFELKRKFIKDIEEEFKQIQEKYQSYKLTAASIDYLNLPTTTIAVLQNNLALKEQLYTVKKNHQSTHFKTKVKLAREIDVYKACILQKQKEEALVAKEKVLNQTKISAFDLFPIMLHLVAKAMCQEEWFKYSPEALSLSAGKQYIKSESITPTAVWKPTIIPSIEELDQRSN